MVKVLKQDEGSLVTLEDGLVRKVVYGMNNSGLRRFPSQAIVDREIRALNCLQDVDGIQEFVRRESENTLYTKYIPGTSLFDYSETLNGSYFEELFLVQRLENKRR